MVFVRLFFGVIFLGFGLELEVIRFIGILVLGGGYIQQLGDFGVRFYIRVFYLLYVYDRIGYEDQYDDQGFYEGCRGFFVFFELGQDLSGLQLVRCGYVVGQGLFIIFFVVQGFCLFFCFGGRIFGKFWVRRGRFGEGRSLGYLVFVGSDRYSLRFIS